MSRVIALVHFMCVGQDQVEVISYILIILVHFMCIRQDQVEVIFYIMTILKLIPYDYYECLNSLS